MFRALGAPPTLGAVSSAEDVEVAAAWKVPGCWWPSLSPYIYRSTQHYVLGTLSTLSNNSYITPVSYVNPLTKGFFLDPWTFAEDDAASGAAGVSSHGPRR